MAIVSVRIFQARATSTPYLNSFNPETRMVGYYIGNIFYNSEFFQDKVTEYRGMDLNNGAQSGNFQFSDSNYNVDSWDSRNSPNTGCTDEEYFCGGGKCLDEEQISDGNSLGENRPSVGCTKKSVKFSSDGYSSGGYGSSGLSGDGQILYLIVVFVLFRNYEFVAQRPLEFSFF